MTSMMGLASAKMSQASLSSTSTNQIATKANSIANSDAELVRATAYNDLSAKTRASAKNPTDGIWLDCNGQSCAGYAELISILGKSTVPDYRNRFLEGSAAPGRVLEAGLPNISGRTWGPMYKPFAKPSGPFTYNGEHLRVGTAWQDDYAAYWINFDASRCSSVYGKSSTVQPPAVTVRWLIKAA